MNNLEEILRFIWQNHHAPHLISNFLDINKKVFDENQLTCIEVFSRLLESLDDDIKEGFSLSFAYLSQFFSDNGIDNRLNARFVIACSRAIILIRPRSTNPLRWANVKNTLGYTLHKGNFQDAENNLDESIQHFEEALDTLEMEDCPRTWSLLKTNLGNSYSERSLGDPYDNRKKAIAAFLDAQKVITYEVDAKESALMDCTLGNLYWLNRKFNFTEYIDLSINAYERALKIIKFNDMPHMWLVTMCRLGNSYDKCMYDRERHFKKALEVYKHALEFAVRHNFEEACSLIYCNIGIAYSGNSGDLSSNTESAIAAFEEGLTYCSKNKSPHNWLEINYNLAIAYSKLPYGTASSQAQKAIKACEAVFQELTFEADPVRWARTKNNIGIALMDIGKVEESIIALKESLIVFKKKRMPEDWARSINNIGRAYIERNKGNDVEIAIKRFKEALSVRKKDIMPFDWAKTMNNIGRAYQKKIDECPIENIGKAAFYFEQSLEVLTPDGYPYDYQSISGNLGDMFFENKDWEQAANAYRSAIEAQNILYRITQSKRGKDLELFKINFFYNRTSYCLAKMGLLEEAVIYTELGRALSLTQSLGKRGGNPQIHEIIEEERSLDNISVDTLCFDIMPLMRDEAIIYFWV